MARGLYPDRGPPPRIADVVFDYAAGMPRAIESVGRLAEADIERSVCFHGGPVEQGTGTIARIWLRLAE